MDKSTEEKISQLQMIEQGLQNFLLQKQQFQSQLIEVDSALTELQKTDTAYKIIGNVMVKADKGALNKDLLSKKEVIELRIRTLEKQEKQMKDKASEMQSEVLKKLKTKE